MAAHRAYMFLNSSHSRIAAFLRGDSQANEFQAGSRRTACDPRGRESADQASGTGSWLQARFVGVSLNTSAMNEAEATEVLIGTSQSLGLPCVDPIRTGVEPIAAVLESFHAS